MKSNLIIAAIFFIVSFMVIYIKNCKKAKYMLGIKTKRKKKKAPYIIEAKFINMRYKIAVEKLINKKLLIVYALLDAFIMSASFLVIVSIPLKPIFQLPIGFIVLFGLIYSLYEILGTILLRKENKK